MPGNANSGFAEVGVYSPEYMGRDCMEVIVDVVAARGFHHVATDRVAEIWEPHCFLVDNVANGEDDESAAGDTEGPALDLSDYGNGNGMRGGRV